jgi:type III secretory pathway component EscV
VHLPLAHTRVAAGHDPNVYRLSLQELPAGEGAILPDKVLTLTSAQLLSSLGVRAEAATDNIFGKSAYWVDSLQSAVLEQAGSIVLDAPALIAHHLEQAARRRPQDWVGFQEVQSALDQLNRSDPALVKNVVPSPVTLSLLTEVLRRLVEDKVSIRPLRDILEALSLYAPSESDPAVLAEKVRGRLARYISHRYAKQGVLSVYQVDPEIEETLRDAVQKGPTGAYLALPPDLARGIIAATAQVCFEPEAGQPPLLLTQSDVRRHLRRLIADDLPDVVVLSHDDLAPEISLKPLKQIYLAGS